MQKRHLKHEWIHPQLDFYSIDFFVITFCKIKQLNTAFIREEILIKCTRYD